MPIRELSVERLAEAFRACARSDVKARAAEIGAILRSRNGSDLAVEAFYRHLPDTADGVLPHLGFRAPGDAYNFSAEEIERFHAARARLGSSPSEAAALDAVNQG